MTPLLCGSTRSSYAQQLKQRLRRAAPAAVVNETFLEPQDLAGVFSRTLLNFHPPETDAFGMTVVEAASQGISCTPLVIKQPLNLARYGS